MKKITLLITALVCTIASFGQQPTVGLIQHDQGALDDGYVLFAPTGSTTTYLIDKCGRQVNSWQSQYTTGHMVYLLSDGSLMRAGNINNATFSGGGKGGILEKFDWQGNIIWSYVVSDELKVQHHDYKVLPNGNVLVIAWEMKTGADAIAAGRNPDLVGATIWGEQILEIEPVGINGGNVVWEWHVWDHLVQDFDPAKSDFKPIAQNPQLIDINYMADNVNPDWLHWNSIDYNAALDQIVVSVHKFGELWIIDHSTTTAQSAGHTGGNAGKGGDILYRWGNPAAYDKGTVADQKLFKQHNVHWIAEGLPYENQIMIFNNGNGRTGGDYSTAEIINPPLTGYNYTATLPYLPAAPTWIYNDNNIHNYYARNMSSAQQLSNGNVLLCNAPNGYFTEITPNGTEVWKYVNPVHSFGIWNQGDTPAQNVAFRCTFYPSDFEGFSGVDLTPGDIIENTNAVSAACELVLGDEEFTSEGEMVVFPNPASDYIFIKNIVDSTNTSIILYSQSGQEAYRGEALGRTEAVLPVSGLAAGIYYLKVTTDAKQYTRKVVVK